MLRKLFRFYIESSIHVSLAVTALAGITFIHFEFAPVIPVLLFVFFGTIAGYNFVKYAGVANVHHLKLVLNLQAIRIFTLICVAVLTFVAFHLSYKALIAGLFFGSLTALYTLPLFKNQNLRNLKGMKVFIIAIVWAGITVMVPLAEVSHISSPDYLLEFLQRFLLVIALMVPFEIRDLKYDIEELGTLPQIFGIQKTQWLGIGLMLLMVLLEATKVETDYTRTGIMAGIALLTTIFIFATKEERPKYFASFWVEGIPILWWVILWVSRY